MLTITNSKPKWVKKQFNIERINKIKSFIVRYISSQERDRSNIYFMDNQIGYISEICFNLIDSNISIDKVLKKD